MNKISLIIFSVLCILLFFSSKGQGLESLLPSQEEITGWKISQQPQIYSGDQLFELIDGGADIYLEYGFQQVISVQYTDPSLNNISVEIYEMLDDAAAYGIFSISQQSSVWSKEFGDISAVNDDYISFRKSKYFISISWSSRQRIDKPLLSNLAEMISGKIREEGNDPDLLDELGYDDFGIKAVYLKGNLALSNFYYFDYKDIFQIREGIGWPMEGYHQIILKYSDESTAEEIAASSKLSISGNKRFTEVTNTFQGFSCKDNKGNEILLRQVKQYIVLLVRLDPEVTLPPKMDNVSIRLENLPE